jgi:hypothetical protein
MQQFQVKRTAFDTARLVDAGDGASLNAGEVRLRIERFAFTANNVTYAAAGDMLGYWQFFPAVGVPDQDTTWGVIPVWGFAEVVDSTVDGIAEGERLFGYFPPANELVITPVAITPETLIDGSAHRAQLPPTYNQYRRVDAEPASMRAIDNERMLLWPLYMTAYCLWDSLMVNNWYDAQQIIVLSASSKTAIGMAYALHTDPGAPAVIGLTSEANCELVASLGIYDRTLTYEELGGIDAQTPSVIVDMSGNAGVLGQLHRHLGDSMKKTLNVGITHWDAGGENPDIIAGRSEMFFAPGHIQQRVAQWGAEGLEQRTSAFIADTVARSRDWLRLTVHEGLPGLLDIYPQVCAGRVPPDEGIIVLM